MPLPGGNVDKVFPLNALLKMATSLGSSRLQIQKIKIDKNYI